MTGPDPSAPGVSYTFKELFERVDEKLTIIDHKLDSKADQADLDALRRDVVGVTAELVEIRMIRTRIIAWCLGVAVGSGIGTASIMQALLR